jgi:hypothetical protein
VGAGLFQTANDLGQADITIKATALLMESLRAVTEAFKLSKTQMYDERRVNPLMIQNIKLEDNLQKAGDEVLSALMGLFSLQGRSWECSLVKHVKDIKENNELLKFADMHLFARRGAVAMGSFLDARSGGIDVLDWTPLHYAALNGARGILEVFSSTTT